MLLPDVNTRKTNNKIFPEEDEWKFQFILASRRLFILY